MLLAATAVRAQITIGGNVYGGGNAGDTGGNTKVTVHAGDLNCVYGGARQANVAGHAFVNVDGEHMSDNIVINYVYGGNDIAGKVGESVKETDLIPEGLIDAAANGITPAEGETNAGENTKKYSAFVLTTKERTAGTGETQRHIFIGQLFGGGNGDYDYTSTSSPHQGMTKPELSKTYLELRGGTIAYAYGGGNNATVTVATDICVDNSSAVTTDEHLKTILNIDADGIKERMKKMGLNTVSTQVGSNDFQFARVFGGNNKAEMAIQPTWHLKDGKIRNLYSGGNQGAMTHKEGLLLEIQANSSIVVDNVFGGCRMAAVRPLISGTLESRIFVESSPSDIQLQGYNFPAGLSARVLVRGGDINNVYGGNDISGDVTGGNAVGVYASVRGDVYGGGNGSYAYTDNADLAKDDEYKDFYYPIPEGKSSVEALNAFRPNAEAVSIRVMGTADKTTVIGGAIYCGGNSATLRNDNPNQDAASELKIGSYVIADKVFLGNNGANMVTEDILKQYAGNVTVEDSEGQSHTYDFSQIDLASETKNANDQTQFDQYMEGVTMMIKPRVVFDSDYVPYSTMFGSIFCGGNVGSMKIDGAFEVSFNDKVIIYDKVVGGSNEANVYQSNYNAQYLGGLLGNPDTNGNKLILNFGGLKIQPKRWKMNGDEYALDGNGNRILEWNTVDSRTFNTTTKKYTPIDPVTTQKPFETLDLYRRFQGGNIYGGCYNNGHVEGNVVINLNASLVDRKGDNAIFDQVEENEGEAKLYDGNYNITKRYTGVLLGEQGMDPLGRALNVFGGGYGGDSEIWGSTTINLNAGYTFQIFGGGEQGAIGRAVSHKENATDPTIHDLTYEHDEKYSTYINLRDIHNYPGTYRGDTDNSDEVVDHEEMAEAEFIYGGSFEGLIAGSTHINLGNGRIFNSFAGSCNADILGHTETYVGRNSNNDNDLGFPWIRDHIYGGNDLGGRIFGEVDFKNRVSTDIVEKVYNPTSSSIPDVLKASAYTEYIQGRVEYIFGGCYGDYDYTNEHYRAYANADGTCKDGFNKPWMKNAFVNFKPNNAGRNAAKKVYGAGQGHTRNHPSDDDRDKMQDRSYVLIDIPQSNTNFQDVEVFGAGDYSGLGMRYNTSATTIGETTIPALTPAIAKNNGDGVTASTVVDLMRGQVKDVYGASYKGGITRRTIVNVPTGSTIRLNRIFGGGYGVTNTKPCDVYESNVNYHSAMAMASGSPDDIVDGNQTAGGIYGGNNNCRRTLYARLNIDAPVRQNEAGYTSRVFGAGYGKDTWTQYTEINLNDGANVYEAYGGGYGGMVLNKQSAANYTTYTYEEKNETTGETETKTGAVFQTLPEEYTNATAENGGLDGSLNGYLVNENPLGKKTNTNVHINKGAYVAGYCYGGGLGSEAVVSGTTYIGLHGGEVSKDMYGGGWGGPVYDKYDVKDFVATTNVFVEGGTLRNVYGGGYQGSVGKHTTTESLPIAGSTADDILGQTNVIVGIRSDQMDANLLNQLKKTVGEEATKSDYGYYHGVPAIQRNAYSGGEGGAVFGDAHLTLNNGYVGYVYLLADEKQDEQGNKVKLATTPEGATARYEAKIHDETYYENKVWKGKDRLKDYGNLFGGGYDDLSCTDESFVEIWGGTVRSSVHGGGEIATIGRGRIIESGENNSERELKPENYYKDGKTHIKMYNGHVLRNVFGGGKGYNINGYGTGANKLYTDGYVFGQTEVYIHGGEIGTEEGVALQTDGTGGYGNVFGGGDVGYVYSPSYFSEGTAAKENTGSPNHIYYKDGNGNLTEDCKVVIAPMLQVKPGKSVSYLGVDYGPYEYVPTEYLNTLSSNKTATQWRNLFTGDKITNAQGEAVTDPDDPVERGILIHNAVFAGGNVSSNTESFANSITVFGNTTATLYDVYHRDFITVGTEHVGGLYGGGNLSMVGGYRELNITNYGTDYYGMDDQISLEKYQTLTNRERAYFKLEYVCQKDVTIGDKTYTEGYRISEDEYNALPLDYKNEKYWKQYGFCSIYAGRLLNTIQRADFCGVFGSRLVLQGAKDRVADVADGTEYTINRIGELSLNQQRFTPGSDAEIHGNYFGIYSVVNYLGNLTSDVRFVDDKRRYVDGGQVKEDTKTYYDWKVEHLQNRDRNNGTSYNQVALASGVYLEITSEKSTPTKKIYGDITGVVELDLINVKKDIEGGGYVYARNEHGQWYEVSHDNTLLSPYNKKDGDEALTKKIYAYYTDAAHLFPYQTSGNFIHKSKRIVDDCYPNNGVYKDDKGVYVTSPAHYWFIKGEVYIYDQVVSAYAGSATAYRKEVKIPLTITAGSNGKLKLLNIQPSLYAYYQTYDNSTKTGTVIGEDGVAVDNESMTFHLNDVITWWDWNQLSDSEKKYFVKDTYVNVDSCTIGGTPYSAGTYILENDPSAHASGQKTAYESFLANHPEVKDAKGDVVTDEGLTKLFRSSNNMSHDTGYVLTFDMNSPKDWDDWYSPLSGNSYYTVSDNTVSTNRKRKEVFDPNSPAYNSSLNKNDYREGPTYTLKSTESSGLYGQRNYSVGEIMTEETYLDYTTTVSRMPVGQSPTGQAEVERAYVALASVGNTQAGSAISTTAYNNLLTDKSNYALAMVCTNTIQLGEEEFILMGELVSGTDANLDALAEKYMNYNNSLLNADQIDEAIALQYIKDNLSNAYYVTSEGLYGGQYYETGTNYGALKTWCELSESRNKFEFNYDALDVLIDKEYHGEGFTETYYKSPYSDIKSVEYVAAYLGTGSLTYYDNYNNEHTIASGGTIEREDYENVRNDQMHYTRLQLDQATATGDNTQTFYIVTENIINNGTPYAKGQDISEKDYNSLTDGNKNKVKVEKFTKDGTIKYYCYEAYTPRTTFNTENELDAGALGSVISAAVFSNGNFVPNYQKAFTIQGSEPTETTTLYVSRESNAKDVMSEKVITVVYQYTYYEADDEGDGVSLVNELHVVNIHVKLESGAPQIGPLTAPSAVLPGNTVRMKAPSVNPGLYEVITNGWEIFSDEDDAALHRNGKPFVNNGTPLYWYENQKRWVAFYSSTYLGKTYSNYVPLTVANYHDMDAVMKDTEHHLYVDHPDVMRKSKIYIDNRDCESDNTKSELDLFKDFFDLSVSGLEGHEPLNNRVKGGSNLEFFLNSNISPKAYTSWTPIGNDDQCFMGNLHGDGYMISGLDHSLFGKLCGNVYNLGVTGSFTSAGVVDTGEGYVENCWVKSTATSLPENAEKTYAVFGNPTDDNGSQVVNSYFWSGNAALYNTTTNSTTGITTSGGDRGTARQMTDREFYNGTVAYNLNGFYLNKRFYDKQPNSGTKYQYLKSENGTLSEEMIDGYYPPSYAFYPIDVATTKYGYVENRYADGDFVYANGTIPQSNDERMRVVNDDVVYVPIWPDDYLYFGQMLTYGYDSSIPHEDLPSHIAKNSGRLTQTALSNRVYRAPAYFRSKDMDVAHYNLKAYLAAYSAPKTVTDTDLNPAYPGMTAIDFAGIQEGTSVDAYKQGYNGKLFYQPLLDDDGLIGIANKGETPNLLVYAPSSTANEKTYDVLNGYFIGTSDARSEPVYSDYTESTYKYGRIAVASTSTINGHLVQSDLKTTTDHLLVDKRDFNCPIAYDMGEDYRMWYQRTPDNFVDKTKGWEGISLPFTAEIVTTQDKGEITHFYQGSTTGHEYWLREYKGNLQKKKDGNNNIVAGVYTADFNPLAATGTDKNYLNQFLWDYYYSYNSYDDKNGDDYQEKDDLRKYYKESRTYLSYPRLANGTPYIIGFPGQTYYEFDLSGMFEAKTALSIPAKLPAQTVTFASVEEAHIGVSDYETVKTMAGDEAGVTVSGFTFKPSYLNMSFDANTNHYTLKPENSSGFSSFDKVPTSGAATPVAAFRPYFIGTPSATRTVEQIVFGQSYDDIGVEEHGDPRKEEINGGLRIWTKKDKIFVESTLSFTEDMRVVTPAGITVAAFDVEPGQTVEVQADFSGLYIVHTLDGLYTKKVAVKRE